jgi:hypothetical protein
VNCQNILSDFDTKKYKNKKKVLDSVTSLCHFEMAGSLLEQNLMRVIPLNSIAQSINVNLKAIMQLQDAFSIPKIFIGLDIHKKSWTVSIQTDLFFTRPIRTIIADLYQYVERTFQITLSI